MLALISGSLSLILILTTTMLIRFNPEFYEFVPTDGTFNIQDIQQQQAEFYEKFGFPGWLIGIYATFCGAGIIWIVSVVLACVSLKNPNKKILTFWAFGMNIITMFFFCCGSPLLAPQPTQYTNSQLTNQSVSDENGADQGSEAENDVNHENSEVEISNTETDGSQPVIESD